MNGWEWVLQAWWSLESRLRAGGERGQGTVEYLGLVMAIAVLLLAVKTQFDRGGSIDEKVVEAVKASISKLK